MPWKDDFITSLDLDHFASNNSRIRINVVHRQLRDFVAQCEMLVDEGDESYGAVVRHDGSHWRAHRDLLDASGHTVRKTWLPDQLTLDEALKYARTDITENWRRYRDDFTRSNR